MRRLRIRPCAARLAGDVLLKEVCDDGDTDGTGRVGQGQAEVLQAALHHAVDIVAVDWPSREAPLLFIAHWNRSVSLGALRSPAAAK